MSLMPAWVWSVARIRPRTVHHTGGDRQHRVWHLYAMPEQWKRGVDEDEWIEWVPRPLLPLPPGLGRCVDCGHHSLSHGIDDWKCYAFLDGMDHSCECREYIVPPQGLEP